MLFQILSLLLNIAGGLLTGACLLRWYMQYQRVSFNNPLGQLVLALTSWMVLPLRKVTKGLRGGDWASILGAWLVQVVQFVLLWLASGGLSVLVVATIGVANIAISTMVVVTLVHAVLSWLSSGNAVMNAVFYQLTAPLLRPLRKIIPLIGGVDLSPIVLLVGLQIISIMLAHLQSRLLLAV